MARSKQYAQRVNILKKVRVGQAWKLAGVVERNGKIVRDHVLISGCDEHHPEGGYYLHPSVIQRMLRHSSPNMTMHYIHSDARKAQEEFVEELLPSAKSFIANGLKGEKGHCGSTICEAVGSEAEVI
jgi:hypothetical protein